MPLLSRTLFSLGAAMLLGGSATAQSPAYVRVALVVGNGAYANVDPLLNPPNDARDMAATLRSQGFKVIELVNGTKAEMLDAIQRTGQQLKGQHGIGLFYFAGHGLQLSERNYLVPVDARITNARDVATQTVDVQQAISAFRIAGNRMNIVVLDACRNNPFAGASDHAGLTPMDAPAGTFLAYATAPGNVAEDGDASSGNGLYTSFLLQELKRPKARIEDVFKRVRYLVRQKSDGRQIPWETTSLEEDFVFSQGEITAPPKLTVDAVKPMFETELADWKKISNSRDAADFYAFVQRYPNGLITQAAQGRIDELNRSRLQVQGGSADMGNADATPIRFKVGQNWDVENTVYGNNNSIQLVFTAHSRVTECDDNRCIIETRSKIQNTESIMRAHVSPSGASLGVETLDPKSGNISSSGKELSPNYLVPPGLLQVGQSWPIGQTNETNGVTGKGFYVRVGEGRIEGREPLQLSMGVFSTFRIQKTSTMYNVSNIGNQQKTSEISFRETYWFAPGTPWPLKSEHITQVKGMPENRAVSVITRLALD